MESFVLKVCDWALASNVNQNEAQRGIPKHEDIMTNTEPWRNEHIMTDKKGKTKYCGHYD